MALSFSSHLDAAACRDGYVGGRLAALRQASFDEHKCGRERMKKLGLVTLALIALPMSSAPASEQLMQLEKDSNQWVMPAGDYANTRFSKLNQITAQNVQDLRPVWSFST